MEVVLICALVIAVCVLILKFVGKSGTNLKNAFYKSDSFETERALLTKLEEIDSFKANDNDGETAQKDISKANHKKLAELIKAGAKIVIASGVSPKTISKKNGLDVITPEVVFQKNLSLATRIISTASANPSDVLWVDHWLTKVTETRKASVAGQAIVGGVIAGAAGAVVGAANAASQNAAGGKEVTAGLIKHHFLSLMYSGDAIDTIYISTSVINQFGEPPEEFVVKKDTHYWLIEANSKNHMIGRNDRSIYDDYLAYITKVLNYYKANAKHKGRFAIMRSNNQ